jgi:hypothetical protein
MLLPDMLNDNTFVLLEEKLLVVKKSSKSLTILSISPIVVVDFNIFPFVSITDIFIKLLIKF